jgi:hypothetical protein
MASSAVVKHWHRLQIGKCEKGMELGQGITLKG